MEKDYLFERSSALVDSCMLNVLRYMSMKEGWEDLGTKNEIKGCQLIDSDDEDVKIFQK